MTTYTLNQKNNQYVEIDGLIDATTKYLADGVTLNPNPTYINTASGELTVNDPTGTPVPTAEDISFSYVAGSNGNYRALIPSTFDPEAMGGFTIVIDLTWPGGGEAHWELPATVLVRNC